MTNVTSDPVASSEPKLRRALNTPLVTLYGLGVTVGAGIYVLVGATAAEAGSYAAVSFLVAAFVVAFTAFSYAELSTRFPVSAGEAAYVEAGFNQSWMATVVGLIVAASGVVSASAVAIGAASYLSQFFNTSEAVLASTVVVVMGLVAILGIVQSVAVAAIITVIEIGGLLFVMFWGFGVAEGNGFPLVETLTPHSVNHWIGIGSASILAFFAFVGFEDMANIAEEVKEPRKTMPRAIVWTLVLATLLYLGTTIAVLVSVPIGDLTNSTAPLSLVFANAGEGTRQTFASVAIIATVNGVLIQMIMASRVIYGLADRDHLPRVFAKVSRWTQTPIVATITVVAIIVVLSQTLPIHTLAEHTSQLVLSVFVLVNIALIRLKLTQTSDGDFFTVPMFVPILGVLTSAMLLTASFF
ncbi:MAG: amino acid permease [Boseongicola sp.]|nr:amino acid permease [Boseongicola sp.]